MVENCINPACSASFRYLREGRVFVTEVEGDSRTKSNAHPRQLRYVWLCNSCCRRMTVIVEKGQESKSYLGPRDRLRPKPRREGLGSGLPSGSAVPN
jgi:hypothetical protein